MNLVTKTYPPVSVHSFRFFLPLQYKLYNIFIYSRLGWKTAFMGASFTPKLKRLLCNHVVLNIRANIFYYNLGMTNGLWVNLVDWNFAEALCMYVSVDACMFLYICICLPLANSCLFAYIPKVRGSAKRYRLSIVFFLDIFKLFIIELKSIANKVTRHLRLRSFPGFENRWSSQRVPIYRCTCLHLYSVWTCPFSS